VLRDTALVHERRYAPPATVSVLIPARNEAARIGACLDSLVAAEEIREVILADGGSSDDTAAIARARGARVVPGERGRGHQIRAAARAATGDVLLVLHADAVLMPGAPGRVLRALSADGGSPGGCFGMAFAEASGKQRLIAALNNLRARTTGIGFGDQAQFIRAAALSEVGGFPGQMLMEDVELSLRLKRLGRPLFLDAGAVVSGRRWQEGSFLKNLRLVVGLVCRYLVGRRFGRHPDGANYYRKYYGKEITPSLDRQAG
jgi:rSAM/selenodomain-associated transferase 2